MSIFNEKEIWLRKSIDSILNQTYKNFEFIIICDNPKNKNIIKIIKEYCLKEKRIIFLINDKNIGLAQSLNRGIKNAKGKYIARMDADDISDNNRIFKQISYMNLNKNIDLISTNVILIDENDNVIRKGINLLDNNEFIKKALNYVNIMNHPTWMLKKDIFKKLNGYINYPVAQDYDFLIRAKFIDVKFGFIDEYLLKYRIRKNSISSQKLLLRLKYNSKINKISSYNEKINTKSVKYNYLETKLFNKSQKLFEIANYYRNNNKLFKFIIIFIFSNIISKYQIRRTINLLKLKFLLKNYV